MKIECQPLDADIVLVQLHGRLDATTSPAVHTTLRELIQQPHSKVVVDFEDVSFVDSSGLALLISSLRLAHEHDGSIALSGMRAQVQSAFRLTMLDRIFAIHPTYNHARQSLM